MTKVKKQTLNTYRWIVEKHIVPAIGDVELTKPNPMIIKRLYNKLTKEKVLSDENIQKVHALINDSLKIVERWGLIARNPAALVGRPKAVLEVCQKEWKILYSFFTSFNNRNETGGNTGTSWKRCGF
ncbi:hypothetical protein V6S04_32225 [Bacillus sp. CCNWLW147]